MILVYILVGIVVIVAFIQLRNYLNFHTKTNCSVCDEPTGIKGNKSFVLKDGYVCQHCIKKVLKKPEELKSLGPNALDWETVDRLSASIRKNSKWGDTEWLADRNSDIQNLRNQIPAVAQSDAVPRCPKCGSASISADKKGFSAGKAAAGVILAGPIGIAAGGIGANKVQITCLNCGHHWIAGQQ